MKNKYLKEFDGDKFEENINIREVIEKYTIYYKWFIFSFLIFGVLAFLKLRYEVPQFMVEASILIKEKEKGSSFSNLASFEDLGLFNDGNNSLENEIQILTSRRLMTKVVKELKLNIRYFIEGKPYDKELYPNFPINFSFTSDSLNIDNISSSFELLIISKKEFELYNFDQISLGKKLYGKDFRIDLGNNEKPNMQFIRFNLNNNFSDDLIGKRVFITISPVAKLVSSYMKKVSIEPVNEKLSKVLSISVNEAVIDKGIAIINNLIEQYNADGVNDKNEITQATTDFLDDRLKLLSTEITAIEGTAEQFKTKNRMIDVNVGSDIFLKSSSANESELVAANTQLQLVNYMFEKLEKSEKGELLPGNIGLSDPSILGMITEFNNLILQRNRILRSSSVKNPIIINIDSQLNVLKNNLIGSLRTLNSTLQIQISALGRQSSKINSKIASVPKNEREYKNIVRQQETKNALYLFLLQKREESILSNAVSINKAKIIDPAYSNNIKVSPKKMSTYLGSIILGLFIPFLIIYIKNLMDTKVHDEKDIIKLRIPYIGDIPLSLSNKNIFISDGDNSNIAEAFRYIRTNINFMLDNKGKGKTIFITSTQSGEGKTFSSINLAYSLALSGKKTLLLGLDLRAPKITNYIDLEDILGVTNFIKNDALTVDDILEKHTKFDNLHIINSGDIPPNPVELLMSKKVEEIFEYSKTKYDFIVVDTAPVGLVTDTIQISKFADITLYVIKANYLDKRMLHIPEKLHMENKLPNMAILINGSDHSKGAYGYGYGYGNNKKKSWFRWS